MVTENLTRGEKGTSGNDKIDGSDMDEKIEGAKGDMSSMLEKGMIS